MNSRFVSFLAISALALTACASTPTAYFPKSTLDTPEEIIGGSAIAFQLAGCKGGGFSITPKLADGKYGVPTSIRYNFSYIGPLVKNSKIDNKNFVSNDKKRLKVKLLPPGEYAISRPFCQGGSSGTYTRPETLNVFLTFTVDANKTNYIGQIDTVLDGYKLYVDIADKSNIAKPQFDERYASRVGEYQVKLAKRSVEIYRADEKS